MNEWMNELFIVVVVVVVIPLY